MQQWKVHFMFSKATVQYKSIALLLLFIKLMEATTYELVLHLLQRMQSQFVNEAEKKLREMVKDPKFFSYIFHIISKSQQQQWVKTMGASFLNSIFQSSKEPNAVNSALQATVRVLLDPTVKNLDKMCFQKSIIHNVQEATIENRERLCQVAVQCLDNRSNIDSAFLIIGCLAAAEIDPSPIPFIINQLFDKIITLLPVAVENASLLNEMLKMWIVILDKLKEDQELYHLTFKVVQNPRIFQLFQQIYQFGAGEGTMVAFQSGLEELNFLKFQAADMHKRLLSFQVQLQGLETSFAFDFTVRYSSKMLMTLAVFSPQRQAMENLGAEDLLTSLLSIIFLYFLKKPEDFVLEEVIKYQNMILLPLLTISDDEKNTFEESPVDFNTLAEDCCDKQTFGTLKTEAAKLLQKFGDKVKGSLQYSVNRAIDSLKIRLGMAVPSSELAVLEIETAFLVLSIFSYGIKACRNEIVEVRQILSHPKLLELPPIEMSRIFTFLAYNYSEIYQIQSEGEGWLALAINYNAHPTTIYCAFDFFSNIVEDYFNPELLDKFTDNISMGKVGLTWDIILSIITNHLRQLSMESLSIIINKTFTRLQRQITMVQKKQKNNTLDWVNCLRVFSSLLAEIRKELKTNPSMAATRDIVIQSIWPIFDTFKISLMFDMDDQIVKVAVQIVNSLDSIIPQFQSILPLFLKQYKITNYQKIYLRFFNQFLEKCNFTRDTNQVINILIALKDNLCVVAQKIALPEEPGKLKTMPYYRLVLSNSLLVVQNAIARFGTCLDHDNNFIHEISSICSTVLPLTSEQVQKTAAGRILQSRALNTLFLCHMHVRIDSIYQKLDMLKSAKLYHGYDTLVLALCIQKQIFNERDPTAILMLLSSLSKIVALSEEKQGFIDKKKNKKKYGANATKINNNMKAYEDYDRILKGIDSVLKTSKDIAHILTEIFSELKKNNFELYNNLLQNMPHEDYKNYSKLVNFENLEKKNRIFRKVVGIKLGNSHSEIEEEINENQNSEDEEQNPLKRQRMVTKIDDKKRKKKKYEATKQHKAE